MSWAIAFGIVVVAAVLEGILSGPKPVAFLASLKQPHWALPGAAWIAVGVVFYGIVFFAVARMLDAGRAGWPALVLLIAMLAANALWNFVLFRRRRLDIAYASLFPYAALVAMTAVAAFAIDWISGVLLGGYLVFLVYDIAWARSLRNLNR
jgi:tryptophan-rich sensory protein